MRLVFMGTPDFSVPILDALVDAGHEIVCVYCQPPRPAGRGKKDRPTPVHKRAEELGLSVRHPLNFKDAADQQAFFDLERRSCGCGGLWFDPATGDFGCTTDGVLEYSCIAIAALAWGRPDPSCDYGGGCADGHLHHADGGWIRYRSRFVAG